MNDVLAALAREADFPGWKQKQEKPITSIKRNQIDHSLETIVDSIQQLKVYPSPSLFNGDLLRRIQHHELLTSAEGFEVGIGMEMEEESEWNAAENIFISEDLLSTVKLQLQFLAVVDKN
ncbi:hypothetical protein L1887_16629 [Cichorium endivia]|nr:hypothetical protein L1887_16629 [Cichorium endivia]